MPKNPEYLANATSLVALKEKAQPRPPAIPHVAPHIRSQATRREIAHSVWEMRKIERISNPRPGKRELTVGNKSSTEMRVGREGPTYIDRLVGLQGVFEYVRWLEHPSVLDVGTGKGYALEDMRRWKRTEGIDLMATGLRRYPELEQTVGWENFRLTTVEVLRGIPAGKLGAVIDVAAIMYAQTVRAATQRIDEVLAPGGILKTYILSPIKASTLPPTMDPRHLRKQLELRGYDVVLYRHPPDEENDEYREREVLLAIKPGRPATIGDIFPQFAGTTQAAESFTAKWFLDYDLSSTERQMAELERELYRGK